MISQVSTLIIIYLRLDSSIRHEPHQRDENIERVGDPLVDEG
ncbi:MAG: hypothetical protein ACR2F2_02215 [Pyrinomonadaceae bacterium]